MANVPLPRFGPEEALVRVRAVGICGSDHRIYADTSPARQAHILGHEVAGEVVAVGGRVASVAPGDRVGIEILPWLFALSLLCCGAGQSL